MRRRPAKAAARGLPLKAGAKAREIFSRFRAELALFFAFALVYALTADRQYTYDSVMYAGMVSAPGWSLNLTDKLTWNHFLWYPTMRAFWLALKTLGYGGLSYHALQFYNAAIGGLCVAVFFNLLKRFLSRPGAIAWAMLGGLACLPWARATGCEPYLTGTLFTLLFCGALYDYLSERSEANFVRLCLFTALATCYHIANAVLWAVPAGLALAAGKDRLKMAGNAAGVLALFAIPYIAVQKLYTVGGVANWWNWGTTIIYGTSPQSHPAGLFRFDLWKNLVEASGTLLYSVAWYPRAVIWPAALPPLLLAAGAALYFSRDRAEEAAIAANAAGAPLPLAFALPLACLLLLFFFWLPENPMYWATPGYLSLGLAAAALARHALMRRPAAAPVILGLALLLGAWNFRGLVLPDMRGEKNRPLLDYCRETELRTFQASPVLISGGLLKVYLPYFAGRRRIALDLALVNAYDSGKDALGGIAAEIETSLAKGVPVYMAGDIRDQRGAFVQSWGIAPEKIDALLAPYKVSELFRHDFGPGAPEALYLLLPKKASKEIQAELMRNLWTAETRAATAGGAASPAAKEYRQKLEKALPPEQARVEMGVSLAEAGRLEEAEQEYRAALAIRADYPLAHFNLAYCLAQQGRRGEAKAEYREALNLDPAMPAALNNLGTLLSQDGDLDGAAQAYRAAVAAKADYAEAWFNLGTVLQKRGDAAGAAGNYRQALNLYPQYAMAHYNLGLALHALGQDAEAMQHLKEAVRLEPSLDPRRRQ